MKTTKLVLILCGVLVSCGEPAKDKNETTSEYGVVSTASPEATKAAIEIMNKGGNAIDAAIAASFALGVSEPAMSGLGGGTQILMAFPGKKPISINGATISPLKTPLTAKKSDLTYHLKSTIPSTVKVMGYIFEKYGSGNVSWEEVLAPAISYASNGFVVGSFRHKVYKSYESKLRNSPFNTSFFLMSDGTIPAPGDTLKQPVLAKTLQRLASKGADDFYHGEIAKLIAQDMEENGGWITAEDLARFPDPKELTPVHTTFRDYDVYSQPPPCGGWTALLILNMLDEYPKEELQPGTKSRFEKVLTAIHLGQAERKKHPISNSSQLTSKLNKDYARELLNSYPGNLPIGKEESGGETTHFSIIDKDGFAVAVTASINAYFGAGAASSELGFLYNTYMDDFEFDVPQEHPFSIGPWKMNYSSMSPTIVQKNDETQLVIGSPGSARIISSVSQLVQLWADTDMTVEEIVAYPRLHSVNNKIYYEDLATPVEWLYDFRKRGFEVAFPTYTLTKNGLNAYFGGIHCLATENGKWEGANDPRRDGLVLKSD